MSRLRTVEVVVGHFNLVDNQYQETSKVFLPYILRYIFTPNKSHANLLNVEPSVFKKFIILILMKLS